MKFLVENERAIILDCMHKKQDSRIYKRLHVIILYDDGLSIAKIASLFYLDEETIRSYIESFMNDGIPDLKIFRYKGKQANLDKPQLNELKLHLGSKIYLKSEDICHYVLVTYGVVYKPKGMAKLLKRLGFVYKKPKVVPGKADGKAQEEFLKNVLEPCLKKASDEHPVYFSDAVHPTHNVHPHYGWILKGSDKAIKTNSGRQRVNINGAICFHTKDVVYREDETINRDSTVSLLSKIRSKHDEDKEITVILDNAKYNRATEVTKYASLHKINILFLPSYSPNLNLIERFWKYFKENVCTRYYEHFGEFKMAVTDFLDNPAKYKDTLMTLLAPNFRIMNTLNF
jgi:transposase